MKFQTVGFPTFRAVLVDAFGSIRRIVSRKPHKSRQRLGPRKIYSGLAANQIISEVLEAGQPSMIARLGTTESAIVEYYVKNQVDGRCTFPRSLGSAVSTLSGFFPPTDRLLSQFAQQSLTHLKEVDVMGVRVKPGDWQFWPMEDFLVNRFASRAGLIRLSELMPVGDLDSWTATLEGKRVLVIHPFARTIKNQYQRRRKLFRDPNFLPKFDLQVIPAVQSVGTNFTTLPYSTWFEALDQMKEQLATRDFDIALIGAGAYGLFLAAECKKIGAIGIQVGGALQLLFGIKGDRWTNPNTSDSQTVLPHINDSWVSPSVEERPLGAHEVEGGCYW